MSFLDYAADKVIKKYQDATCDQLKALKDEPPSDKQILFDRKRGSLQLPRRDRRGGVGIPAVIVDPAVARHLEIPDLVGRGWALALSRVYIMDKTAASVLNKMFECRMIP